MSNVLRESMLKSVSDWQENPLGLKDRDHVAFMGGLIFDLMNFLTDDQLLDVLRAHQVIKDEPNVDS